MMHILFITHEYPTKGQNNGGVGTMVKFIAEDLIKRGHRVSVMGEYKNQLGTNNENGVELVRLPYLTSRVKLGVLSKAKQLNQQIAQLHKRKPIHVIDVPELGLAFLKKIKGIKYVVRMNGGHHFFAYSEKRKKEWQKVLMEKYSFRKADHIVAVSEYVHTKTWELLGKNEPVTIINNPVDTSEFSKADQSKTVPGRIVFVGSIVEKKGIRQLIQAMPIIKMAVANAHLVAVGRPAYFPGTSKPYEPYLETFFPNNHKEYITFTGGVPHSEVVNYIASAEICVYPSHMEALPLAWLEALGMGKPFIGSKTGPGPEVVNDGETGLLCDPYSPEDIAEKAIHLFKNPEFAKQLGINAYNDVQKRFSIEVLGKKNEQFYQSIIEQ